MGAIGEDGAIVLNRELIARLGLGGEEVQQVIERERVELERRLRRYRGERPPEPVSGRTVILVDDGLATGATARAAIQVLRLRGARRVVLAVPVAPPHTAQAFGGVADEVVVVQTPEPFFAIGQFYVDFAQTSDAEVAWLLGVPGAAPVGAVVAAEDPVRGCDIEVGGVRLAGDLAVPASPVGVVVFAHGSGSSRHSPRNRWVAGALNQAGLATLLLDLLTPGEELDRAKVFDIGLLAQRLVGSTRWLGEQPQVGRLPVGYFGASTGAGAALWAAAELGGQIAAVVSRGGRPDLAGARLAQVRAPTLLIVGGRDEVVLELNRQAQAKLRCEHALEIVPGATHLFEEPGTLDQVAVLAAQWFTNYLPRPRAHTAGRHATPPSG
jgi:putative phosphoribosyl transferase